MLYLGNGVLDHEGLLNLVHDIALLHSLGIRLVLVHANRGAIEVQLAAAGQSNVLHRGIRVTDAQTLELIQAVNGRQRAKLEQLLSMGLPNSPMRGSRLRVVGGNFVTARPLGVVDGVDFQFTGAVRRIDAAGIVGALAQDAIVLLSPTGYSPAGEAFNLCADEVATVVAVSLGAEKLILLNGEEGLRSSEGQLIRQCTTDEARHLRFDDADLTMLRDAACRACDQGVQRAHLISFRQDGALLQELLTHIGAGTLISEDRFEQMRPASGDDISSILELVRPLEDEGILVRRSRELLEQEISRFRVLERDGRIVACAALYPFEEERCGEIACIATHPEYQRGGRGTHLLSQLIDEAKTQGLERVFVLTTQTSHWFQEQGFSHESLEALPLSKQALYNLQRNSKVFIKTL